MSRRRQQPGKLWTFSDGTIVRLPKKIGESNDIVAWSKNPRYFLSGYWWTRKRKRGNGLSYYWSHVERESVRRHYNLILRSRDPKHALYKGMPFFDEWNPAKGGSFDKAEAWIIGNLGKRPECHSLHIVEHGKGFVPGNLAWANRQKQNSQRMFLIISNLRHEIIQLKLKIKELESRI